VAPGARSLPSRAVQAARGLAGPGRPLLVAVSGGVDSTVLLHVLAEGAGELGAPVAAGHVHHGLRGAGADADAAFVAERAAALGVAFLCERVDPEARRQGRSSRARPTLQEAARSLRYAALARLAARWSGEAGLPRAPALATAHTADDQAETVLLRLLRGCGPEGLAGIPERSADGGVVRPLLGAERAEVEAFARARGLPWREDPSNADPRYARSRLRARWLPGLAADFNPRLLRALGDLAEAQREEAAWTAAVVEAEAPRWLEPAPGGGVRVRRAGFEALPVALARRLVRRAWTGLAGRRDLSRVHLERLRHFAVAGRAGAVLELPSGIRVRAEADGVVLWRAEGVGGEAGC